MAKLQDYHTHTAYSCDASGTVAELVNAAEASGVSFLAITEHVDFVPTDPSCGYWKPEAYRRDVEMSRRGKSVQIAMGMELGVEPEHMEESSGVALYPIYGDLDFVIGSVHAVDDCLLGGGYFRNRTRKQAFWDYLLNVKRAVKVFGPAGIIDVVGHLDVVKRYAPPGFADGWLDESIDLVRDVVKAIVESGVGLEVNVSGFRQQPKEQYPSLEILRIYREMGGEILTIGSDSHTARNLMVESPRLKQGQQIAREAGFARITAFVRRKPVFITID